MGFGGAGQNVGVSFTTLKDFDERTTPSSEYANTLNTVMAKSGEGSVMSILPPPIDELGTYSGFSLRLQDKANLGMPALIKPKSNSLKWHPRTKNSIWCGLKVYQR
jgi:multidrug efflux pump